MGALGSDAAIETADVVLMTDSPSKVALSIDVAKITSLELDVKQNACLDCTACSVKCPSGFNVSKKIAAIMPVIQVPNEFLT